MKFSIIVSTYNRAEQLAHFLRKLPIDSFMSYEVEIFLVDNASTDNTPEVIQQYLQLKPEALPFSVLKETRKGKVHALNQAMKMARGEYLVFTDDDCYLAEDYFYRLSQLIAEHKDSIDYFGGKIDLFDSADDPYCSSLHIKEDSILIPAFSFVPTGHIQGANMVFKKSAIEKIGLFDPNLGPHTSFRFEDIDYAARASMKGLAGKYSTAFCVYHHHGRKPFSAELIDLIKKNDFSRGAYYMKLLLLGNLKFVPYWKEFWFKIRSIQDLKARMRELGGFFQFFLARLVHTLSQLSYKINLS